MDLLRFITSKSSVTKIESKMPETADEVVCFSTFLEFEENLVQKRC